MNTKKKLTLASLPFLLLFAFIIFANWQISKEVDKINQPTINVFEETKSVASIVTPKNLDTSAKHIPVIDENNDPLAPRIPQRKSAPKYNPMEKLKTIHEDPLEDNYLIIQ